MNITQQIADDRQLVKEISQIECLIVDELCNDEDWLSPSDEAILRWALSLARVSKVPVSKVSQGRDLDIGHATDRYRQSLFNTLSPFVRHDGKINKREVARYIKAIGDLCRDESKDLLQLYGAQLSPEDLARAVRSRPLALALGGGGGTAFVYLGAFEALQQEGIIPGAIAGTSMGAIIGAYRARYREFSLSHLKYVFGPISFDRIARPLEANNKYSVPATFRLHLREVFGRLFENEKGVLRLRDLKIPFRVAVAAIAHIEGRQDENLDEFAHLLDDSKINLMSLRREGRSIISKLIEMTKWPLKAIYLGADETSKEFDVVDAIGFSSAVPGIFHYDVMPGDKRMRELVEALMKQHGVYRLIDGGWVDNLPSQAALDAVQEQPGGGRDPFVLALNGFAPNLDRHWMFMPLMQVAAQNSKRGREVAHRTITYKRVLSPLKVVPSKEEFVRVLQSGIEETLPHIPFIRKMVGPIDDPEFVKNQY